MFHQVKQDTINEEGRVGQLFRLIEIAMNCVFISLVTRWQDVEL